MMDTNLRKLHNMKNTNSFVNRKLTLRAALLLLLMTVGSVGNEAWNVI